MPRTNDGPASRSNRPAFERFELARHELQLAATSSSDSPSARLRSAERLADEERSFRAMRGIVGLRLHLQSNSPRCSSWYSREPG
jgi:hypothetical protein